MRKSEVLLFVFAIFFFISCKKDNNLPEGKVEIAMLDSVNKLRVAGCTCGEDIMAPVPAIKWNVQLADAAAAHARDMYNRNYFEHVSPEGTSALQRAAAVGYEGTTVLENIGRGYKSTAAVISAWKASESHCKAMMDPVVVEMGAYSYGAFWVQEFGK